MKFAPQKEVRDMLQVIIDPSSQIAPLFLENQALGLLQDVSNHDHNHK